MSERSYIVYIDDLSKLSFKEFYNDFLNKDGEYQESYVDNHWDLKTLKKETRKIYDSILEDITYISSDYFYDRHITSAMTDYIASVGMPIQVRDISGWSPMITVLHGEMKHKYVDQPELDLENRFTYMLSWAKECGLHLGKKGEQ